MEINNNKAKKSHNKTKKYYRNNKKHIQNEPQILSMCSLCKDKGIEISMPCAGMHSYCFSCIIKWLITKKELTCPECRKICEDIIKIPKDKNLLSVEFLDFLESVKIIPNPLKHDEDCKCFQTYFDNTCVYPRWTLLHFIENKSQLELYYESVENPKYKDNVDQLIKLIKWYIFDEDEKSHNHAHINHS